MRRLIVVAGVMCIGWRGSLLRNQGEGSEKLVSGESVRTTRLVIDSERERMRV